MKKLIIVILIGMVITLSGCKAKVFNPSGKVNTQYDMNVYLDGDEDTLHVTGSLEYTNYYGDLSEMYIMFYANGTYYSDEEPNVVFNEIKIDDTIANYTLTGVDNEAMHITFDEVYSQDDVISVSFDYIVHLWDDGRIYANVNSYYAMFFYPIIPVHDNTGWNIEPYTYRGETLYTDLSDFDITLNTPEEIMVASGGKEINTETNDGRTVTQYELDNARDYSFSASDRYKLYEREIEGITLKIYDKGMHNQADINFYFNVLEDSFRIYQQYIGPYYYDYFTLELGDIYGMESSSIIYCSDDVQEGTIVHEVVHQWFFFMIGNDQYDESFLDEALTTYASALYYGELYGEAGYNSLLDYRDSGKTELSDKYETYSGQSLLRTVDELEAGYGYLIYYHGTTMIRYYIDNKLGGDFLEFFSALEVYYDVYNGKTASIDDFLTILEEETGVDGTKEWFMFHLNEMQPLINKPN